MKRKFKKTVSMLLVFCMLSGMMPQITIPVLAASNLENGFEGQDADIFSALGFDTSVVPEGYDAETTDNPYGRDTVLGNQVMELLLRSDSGYSIAGVDDNEVNPANIPAPTDGTGINMQMFTSAAADFDGDGLPGEVVYAGYETVGYDNGPTELVLRLYDAKTDTPGTVKTLTSFTLPIYEDAWDYYWQNYLQVAAGDYDGDGTYEIAVYIPEKGSARVDIYKYQKTSESDADDWRDLQNWGRVWSHAISTSSDMVPNMVSLATADINMDGIDDLAISSGYFLYETNDAKKSTAVILWGSRTDMLHSYEPLDLNETELGDLVRVSLIAGDLDQDGNKELIATGQPLKEAVSGGNNSRTITTYIYSEDTGLVVNSSGIQKPLDGEWVTAEYDTGDGVQQTTKWQSNNGFDSNYYSTPMMRTNAAAFKAKGADYPYLYLDSCLYECVEGQFMLKISLDDLSYDNENYLNNKEITSAADVAWGPKDVSDERKQVKYAEYGAVAADINGEGFDTLAISYYSSQSYEDYHIAGLHTLVGSSSGVLWSNTQKVGEDDDLSPIGATMVDVDLDTYIIEYTGQHYLTYSNPKVIAIIAAAPYFEDVDEVYGYDYAWQNTTAYATIKGDGSSTYRAMDLEYGNYVSASGGVGGGLLEVETSINFTLEWQTETANATEYVLEFETSQDEDSIAFFSIPTENFVYRILTPDGNGGYRESLDVISKTFAPVNQILTLDYYESIQGNYDSLPKIAGKAITSTPGDPSSYPSSTSGYEVISQWKDDPAGVSFGNGSITQEITITEEEADSFNLGSALDFKAGGGSNVQSDILQSELEAKAGVQFSLNPSGGWTKYNMTGTTISGTVTNMPLEFQQYGYYYNWKIFSYKYELDKDNYIPVVSYIVNDVSQPPELPEDFQQDYDRTTSSQNVLTWTYDDVFSNFYIYKYFDFPVGGGLQMVKEIPSNTTDYLLKYDENGKPYKEYYFVDENLAPYTEYEYAIQVERLSETPPLSSPSALVSVRTKAKNGNPVMMIAESDGENDRELLIYPDKNSSLTVEVTGPDGEDPASYYTTVQYQWQKQEKGAWTDIVGETRQTLDFINAGVDTVGEYRCRVNVLTSSDATAITAYTDSVSLTHAKRSAYFEEIYVHDVSGGGVELFAKLANGHGDSASIPGGTVVFNLINNATGITYQRVVKVNTAGIASIILDDGVPEGMYSVEGYYSGSFIFKSCNSRTLYLSQRSSGYDIDVPLVSTFGDGSELVFRNVSKAAGITNAVEALADSYILLKGDTPSTIALGGAETVPEDMKVTRGNNYRILIDDVSYYFTASHSGEISIDDRYVVYDAANDITSAYISYTNEGGKYKIAENLPAGGYVMKMSGANGKYVYASFTVEQRKLTLQLPTQKGDEGSEASGESTDAPSVPFGSVSVVSGSWAACDMPDGKLRNDIADTGIYLDYINTAGKIFSRWSVDGLCGYYTIRAQAANANRAILQNYKVTYLDGSITILGATQKVSLGVRPFEGQQVGALYAISPEYGSTRTDLFGNDVLIQNHATGTRMVFTAVPDEGYEIYDWYINGVSQNRKDSTIFHVLLAEETTVEVQFAVKQNSLIFGTAGDIEGGTIVCSDPDLASESAVLANAHFFFTAKAKDGYHFKEWRYTEVGKGTAYDDTDNGKLESSFELLMPGSSCSVYAVFERDFYTFSYVDRSGIDGLTAWYEGSVTGDITAAPERIYIESGDSVKGDTVITVSPKTGYLLESGMTYVSDGSQGTADYTAGTYVLTLKEDTTVSSRTIQDIYDLTLEFDVQTHDVFPEGTKLIYTIGSEESVFDYIEDESSLTISDIPGGSYISARIEYPLYYDLEGFTNDSTQVTATDVQNRAAEKVIAGGSVEEGLPYYYEENSSGSTKTWYFIAPTDGTARWEGSQVTVFASGVEYAIETIGADETITVHLAEKPTYTVTMEDITGKGTYDIELPEGAYQTGGSNNQTLVTVHEGDNFIVLITPEQKWTVSYWRTTPQNGDATQVRATSLKYMIPAITMDFSFAPVFSPTTYNTISWPTIEEDRNGLTLSPLSGYLSRVVAGGEFKFKLSGSTLDLLNQIFVNGEPFVAESASAGKYTYTGEGKNRIYTISDIQENMVITTSLVPLGVTVNGEDIVAMNGPGWSYDHNAQILTLNRSNLVISGRTTAHAPMLYLVAGPEAVSVVLENLTMDPYSGTSSTRSSLIAQSDDFTITINGDNFMEGKIDAKNLTIRGNGALEVENDADVAIGADNLTLLGSVNLEVLSVSIDQALRVTDSLNMGTADSKTAHPTLRVSRGGLTAHTINTYAGLLSVKSRTSEPVSDAVYCYDLNNYGGVMELTAPGTHQSVWLENGSGWKAYYPQGYMITYTDENGVSNTEYKLSNGYSNAADEERYDILGAYRNGYYNAYPSISIRPVSTEYVTPTLTVENEDGRIQSYNMSEAYMDKFIGGTEHYQVYLCMSPDPSETELQPLIPDVVYNENEYNRMKDYIPVADHVGLLGEAGGLYCCVYDLEWEKSDDGWTPVFHTDNTENAGKYDFTVSGVWGEGANIVGTVTYAINVGAVSINKLTLSNMTVLEGYVYVNNAQLVLEGDNVLYNVDGLYGGPLGGSNEMTIRSNGEGTLTLVGYEEEEALLSADTLNLVNVKEFTLLNYDEEGSALDLKNLYVRDGSVQEYSTSLSRMEDKVVPYGYGWKQDVGSDAAQAKTQKAAAAVVADQYTRIYASSSDAAYVNGDLMWDLDLANGKLYTLILEPTDGGYTRSFDHAVLIDAEGNETALAVGDYIDRVEMPGYEFNDIMLESDFMWAGRYDMNYSVIDGNSLNFISNLPIYEGALLGMPNIKELTPGRYTVRTYFEDPDPSDATFYYLDIPLEIRRSQTTSNTLSIAPETASLGRNQEITFTANYLDNVPSHYIWYVNDVPVEGEDEISYTYTVPADAEIGEIIQIRVESYEGATRLGYANAALTITASAAEIAITCGEMAEDEDGSYTVKALPDGVELDFDALVTLDTGEMAEKITWSLWGNTLLATSIDEQGLLTIDPEETGTGDMLRVTATYTNVDGTAMSRSVIIYLTTDAWITYFTDENEGGRIIGATADGEPIDPEGVHVPAGSTVVVQAEPDEDKVVSMWFVNDLPVEEDEDYTVDRDNSTLIFTAEKMGDYFIHVSFEEKTDVKLTYGVIGRGSLGAEADGEAYASDSWVPIGTSVTFTAEPDENYVVKAWYVDGVLQEGTIGNTFTLPNVTDDCEVTVEFTIDERAVTVIADEGGTVSVDYEGEDGVYTVLVTDAVVLTATPDEGHEIENWAINTMENIVQIGGESFTLEPGSEDVTIYVNFKEPDHVHSYTEAVTEPTCNTMGYTTYTCDCNHSYKADYVDAAGHDFEEVVTVPTCTTMGYTTYICECGYSYKGNYVEAAEHIYKSEIVEPTCEAMGYTIYTCECGHSYKGNYVDVSEHIYYSEIVAPTCTENGYTKYTCGGCGNSYVADIVEATGHSCTEEVTEPTCTTMGYTTYTCECGHSYKGNYVDVAEHQYKSETMEPTCTENGYTRYTCTACGHTYVADIVEADGHYCTAVVTEPTCTTIGYTTYTCECGHSYKSDFVDPHGHHYTTKIVAATCTENGFTEYICTVCGHSYIADIVEAAGHIYSSVVTVPTHDAMGYTTHTCGGCGHSYVDSYTDALGHEYEKNVTKEASCTSDGELTFTCECGKSYTQVIPKTEHSFTKQITAPTCTTMGYTTYICDCEYSYTSDYVDTLEHDLEEVIVEPDCMNSGYTQVECGDCGFSAIKNLTEPTGDHEKVTVGEEEPTYTHMGYTGDIICKHCGTVIEVGRTIPTLEIPDAGYADIEQGTWYTDAVNYMAEVGLMQGVGDNSFAPEMETTRAMVVTMLYRLEGEPDVSGIENHFTDVEKNTWYYDAVIWASANGVVKGISETLFAPGQTVTREQMVTMIHRYAGEPEADLKLLDQFPDGEQVSGYAKAAFSWAIENGIITGNAENGQTLLKPQTTATRAQIAAIFMRFMEN